MLDWSTSIPTGTNAGSYKIHYRVVGDSNWYSDDGGNITAVIEKQYPGYDSLPTEKSMIYNGEPQVLLEPGISDDGTFEYSLDLQSWSTTIPSGINAQSYKVYYRLIGDANHKNIDGNESRCVWSTISKATPKAPTISPNSIVLKDGSPVTVTVTSKDGDGEVYIRNPYSNFVSTSVSGNTITITKIGSSGSGTLYVGVREGTNYEYYYPDVPLQVTIEDALKSYKATTGLSAARGGTAATSVGDYAIFSGGYTYNERRTGCNNTEAYNSSLTRTLPTKPGFTSAYVLDATSIGDYAIFGGYNTFAYNKSLTLTSPIAMSTQRDEMGCASNGAYAIFGGGSWYNQASNYTYYYKHMSAYNASLTETFTYNGIGYEGYGNAGATDNYVIFDAAIPIVFDKSLTKTELTTKKTDLNNVSLNGKHCAYNGRYLIYLWQVSGSQEKMPVFAYNNSLTASRLADVGQGFWQTGSTRLGEYAIFGGVGAYSRKNYILAYDTNLTLISIDGWLGTEDCGYQSEDIGSTTIGNYAMFGGLVKWDGSNRTYKDTVGVCTYNN